MSVARSALAGEYGAAGKRDGARRAGDREPAELRPVARVAVDLPLPHLDRIFDYLVTADQDEQARPGVRVRVRFSGRLTDGFLLERVAESDHPRLAYLERVVSPEVVLTPEVAALCRQVADRYAGTLADVLRLAVPNRHARAEHSPGNSPTTESDPVAVTVDPAGWQRYPAGPAFLAGIGDGRALRAGWQALPGEQWPDRLVEACATVYAAGRGALVVVPDARDLARLAAAAKRLLPAGSFVALSADLGPETRYRRFLAVARGTARVVLGTRAAAFAPVRDLGLVAVWDDGDESLAEPRAPYPHAREVLMLRSAATGCPLLVGGFARTAEAALLVDSGWARDILPERETLRAAAPRIEAAGDRYAVGADSVAASTRITPAAFAAARGSLAAGHPVLVQVPRRGYLPGLACARCRRPARCRRCHGPLGHRDATGTISCRWCGAPEAHFVCGACGGTRLRSTTVGASRTAEELGRAFPGVTLITSAGQDIRDRVPGKPAIVVATPGAEPLADGGYGAALLLDGTQLLGRSGLRAAEDTLRRWLAAAALVRPVGDGGRVVIGADAALPTVQAAIRWDPAGHAAAELAARAELGFPPAVAMASLEGTEHDLAEAAAELTLPPTGELLGPVPLTDLAPAARGPRGGRVDADPDAARMLVRVASADRKALATALSHLTAARSVRKGAAVVRVRVDPEDLF